MLSDTATTSHIPADARDVGAPAPAFAGVVVLDGAADAITVACIARAPYVLAGLCAPTRRQTAVVGAVLDPLALAHAHRSVAVGAVALFGARVPARRGALSRASVAAAAALVADDLLPAHAAHGAVVLAVRAVAEAVLLVATAAGSVARHGAGAARVRRRAAAVAVHALQPLTGALAEADAAEAPHAEAVGQAASAVGRRPASPGAVAQPAFVGHAVTRGAIAIRATIGAVGQTAFVRRTPAGRTVALRWHSSLTHAPPVHTVVQAVWVIASALRPR